MKTKLFTLLLAIVASAGTMFANKVQIGDLYYNLDDENKTAEVTSQNSESPYWSTTIRTAYIPSSVENNSVTYTVTSIGGIAFFGCTSLTSIEIPKSVTRIDYYAFFNCTGLTSITIPNSVTSIGEYAFSGCTGLTSLEIPNSVTSIGVGVFSGCTGLTSVTIGNSVTSISAYAFQYCNRLTSVTIGNSVTSIGDKAFYGCHALTAIYATCGDLDRIKQLFDNDSRVKYKPLQLQYSLSTIAQNGNISTNIGRLTICDEPLVTLTVGANYGYHFAQWLDGNTDNPRIIELTKDTTFTAILAANTTGQCGDDLQWSLADSILTIAGTGNMWNEQPWVVSKEAIKQVVFPQGITGIGNGAFSGCRNIRSIDIPNSVTSIGSGAFLSCTGLASITIGNRVTSIGGGAFSGCIGLTSIEIPNSVTSIGGNSTFAGCTGLTSVIIGNGITSIVERAFYNCTGLTSIEIPNSVTSIGDGAFNGCSSLTSVTIGNSVTSIGRSAFYGCSSLTSVTIGNGVTSIGNNAFDGCWAGLISMTISNNVADCNLRITGSTSLEHVAAPAWFFDVQESDWANCPKYLQTITVNAGELNDNILGVIARSYKTLTSLDLSGVTNTEVADETVKGFYNMTELKLPSNTEYIGYMAVADCKSLQEITIPASVKEIDNSAFENCRSLKSITFGGQAAEMPGRRNVRAASTSQLQRIGNWAFYNCHELQNLTIPEGVTEIGDGAFYGCTYLEDLSLPSSVLAVGDNTFALCAKMKKIVVNAATPPSIQAKTFFDVKRQIPVYVPDECVDAYKNDALWSEFNIMGISHMPDGIEEIYTDSDKPVKLLHNNQILILRGDKTYTLQGQEVK